MTPLHLQIVQNYITCHKELRHGLSKPWYRIEITARVRKSFQEDAKTFSAIYREAIIARKFLWNFQAFHCIILYYTLHYGHRSYNSEIPLDTDCLTCCRVQRLHNWLFAVLITYSKTNSVSLMKLALHA